MISKPTFNFDGLTSAGLDKVPLNSLILIESTGQQIILTDKTTITDTTTITTLLGLTSQYIESNPIVYDSTPQLGGELDSNGKTFNASSYRGLTTSTISVTGTHTFNFLNADMERLTLSGTAITMTIAFSGFVAGKVCSMVIDLVNAGSHTVTYPTGTLFAIGLIPTYTSGTDRILVIKDASDVYTITVIGLDIKAAA